jgi:hypothetical protein
MVEKLMPELEVDVLSTIILLFTTAFALFVNNRALTKKVINN